MSKSISDELDEILDIDLMTTTRVQSNPMDFEGVEISTRTRLENHAKDKLKRQINALITKARIDPFDFVEPCEPDCSPERHAYHQGQWDMAARIKKHQEENL
jgi:Txe/YoeB family toxin of Txe-Axe toxin-antitoxin module